MKEKTPQEQTAAARQVELLVNALRGLLRTTIGSMSPEKNVRASIPTAHPSVPSIR